MIIGFHYPFAGGIERLKKRYYLGGGNAFQIYTRGMKGGKLPHVKGLPSVSEKKMKYYDEFIRVEGIECPVLHAPLSFDLTDDSGEDWMFKLLLEDLEFAERMHAKYYVIQPGRKKGNPLFYQLGLIQEKLVYALDNTNFRGEILVKNMAGEGTELGGSIEEFKDVLLLDDRVKGALDLSRIYLYGEEFTNEVDANMLFDKVDREIGWENIKLLYVNDTLRGRGARKNNFVPLGEGVIDFEGYKHILPKLTDKVWISEHHPDEKHYRKMFTFFKEILHQD